MNVVRTLVTLVTGQSAAAREQAIVAALSIPSFPEAASIAILLEGVPDGSDRFDADAFSLLHQGGMRLLPVVRIAPGCLCCTGNLAMRVHLNRLLRARPSHLYIGVATVDHLASLRQFLAQPPYDGLLDVAGVIGA